MSTIENAGTADSSTVKKALATIADASGARKLVETHGACHGTIRSVTLNCKQANPDSVTCIVEFASHEQASNFARSLGEPVCGSNAVALEFDRQESFRCGQTLPLKHDCCVCHPRR